MDPARLMAPLRGAGAMLALGLLLPSAGDGFQVEAGTTTIRDTIANPNGGAWDSISFTNSFDVTPLVFVLATEEGGDPSAVRIRDVTTTGFEWIMVEPSAQDGAHIAMTGVSWIAITPGTYDFADGTEVAAVLQAGVTAVQHGAGVTGAEGWQTVSYGRTFSGTPVILAQIQTDNSEVGESSVLPPLASSVPWLTIAVEDSAIGTTSVDVALERSESGAGSVAVGGEDVAVLAMDAGTFSLLNDSFSTITGEATLSADNITGGCTTNSFSGTYTTARVMVAVKNRNDGGDGGWLRECLPRSGTSYDLYVEEDTDNDTEQGHTAEAAGIVVFSLPFTADYFPDISATYSADTVFSDPVGADIYHVPGSVVELEVEVVNAGLGRTDANPALPTTETFFIEVPIQAGTSLVVDDFGAPGSGPVEFDDPDADDGVTYSFTALANTTDDVRFFDGITWDYGPTADGDGVDTAVTHFRVLPQGRFAGATSGVTPDFTIRYRVRIDD